MANRESTANLRAEMARQDITQADIAKLLGITAGQVSARMNGRIEWRLSELETVAAKLGVPVAELLASPADAAAVTR